MSDNIHWLLEVAINDGELDNFKTLMSEMIEHTQSTQPGTTHYEWFFSDDETACSIYERYADSAATMIHLAGFGELWAERFLATCTPTRWHIFGPASDEIRAITAGFGAVHMAQAAGYARV